MADELSEELKEQCENGSLSPEQLAELAQALGKCKAVRLAKLRKLAAARLIDRSPPGANRGTVQIDPDALAELLCQCEGSSALCECLGAVQSTRTGRSEPWTGRRGDDLDRRSRSR